MPSLPPVVICAPGRSCLAGQYGTLIDSFETVVRFQGAEQFQGTEDLVGSKTDICVFNGSWEAVGTIDRTILLYKEKGHIPGFFWTPSFSSPDRQAVVDKSMDCYGAVYGINSFDRIFWLQNALYIGDDFPSSGLVVIDHLLQHCDQIAIHGYDLVDGCGDWDNYSYYWDKFPRILPRIPHFLSREATYIRRLMFEGRVVLLRELAEQLGVAPVAAG